LSPGIAAPSRDHGDLMDRTATDTASKGGPLLSDEHLEGMLREAWNDRQVVPYDRLSEDVKVRLRNIGRVFAQWGWDDRDQQVHGLSQLPSDIVTETLKQMGNISDPEFLSPKRDQYSCFVPEGSPKHPHTKAGWARVVIAALRKAGFTILPRRG